MTGQMGKRVALAAGVALATTVLLLLLASIMVVQGVWTTEQVPLWVLRLAGIPLGCLIIMRPKQRKRRRKKRR